MGEINFVLHFDLYCVSVSKFDEKGMQMGGKNIFRNIKYISK